MYMSVCLSVGLSVCLSVCMSSICLSSVFLSSVTLVCAHCHTHIHIHIYIHVHVLYNTYAQTYNAYTCTCTCAYMHTDKTYTPHVHAQCFIHMHHVAVHVYMLGSKHGFEQSMDGTAQSVEPCFEQQSMDCLLIPWSAQTEGRKAWIQAIHGLKRTKRVFAVAAAPSRKGRGPGIAGRC